ncbi:Demethylsterigmatocystin 6-O-methyltransferase [Cercospora beticola]|uniref:Demethylsterigmatocystin 6-O-methyltransferase n=1 Tax=Cercospora beticola TaxID=122368 RepID=A0A2G5HKF9_CERBT|nr:Demethylsterigmatocystin 6-O-methyltransferase [Cercospora beticola]PIA93020.1 Demethylsterigmatocystin 6-O-methyltransferase [Cercospora beticola]WPB01374.1 hypothetical protein RHO25_006000 [Cercospora beticola]CAK1363846.1 unnamed protein product [Cercospora beticola]
MSSNIQDDSATHLETLRKLDKTSFQSEASRIVALNEARALVRRLEQPWERMYDVAWTYPAFIASLRVAQDLNIFSHLTSSPQSSSQLAEKVGADPVLLRRLLRVLVKEHIIDECSEEADAYLETEISRALKDPEGVVTGLDVYYLAGMQQEKRLPEYLKETGYENPEDGERPPWKWIEGVPDYEGDRWSWMKTRPEHQRKFNQFLAAVRKDSVAWTELYGIERVVEGWDGESVVLVDIGGGNGRDVSNFAKAIERKLPSAKVVLQERKEVIDGLKDSDGQLHPQIELMPHNFFESNPVKGAKVYFMHAIIHDWAENKAREILARVRDAMKPGYSRLLLFDRVVPERATDWDARTAALDINMMCNYASLERTEVQWKGLIKSAGLKYLGYRKVPGPSSFIEAEL